MYYRISYLFTFLGFFLLFADLHAQQRVTPEDILKANRSSVSRALLQKNIDFLQTENQSMPFVEEIELRTESDEMELGRQEYLFRMRFNSRESRRVQDRITNNNLQHYELKTRLLDEQEQIDRYEYLAEWYYLDAAISALADKKIILEDQRTVYQKNAVNAPQLDITSLLKVEEDLQELAQEQLQLQLQREVIIENLLPDITEVSSLELEKEGWISLETMRSVLEEVMADTAQITEIAMQELEVNAAQLEYEMERAESRRILEFAQAKYAGRDNLSFAREFSFGLGFMIPTKSNNRVEINEAQLERADEVFQLSLLILEWEEDVKKAYQKFDQIWQAYQLLKAQIETSKYADTLEKYKKTSGVSPLTLLQLQSIMLKQERDVRRLEEAACFRYLELLSLKGMLHSSNSINYLSDARQSFR